MCVPPRRSSINYVTMPWVPHREQTGIAQAQTKIDSTQRAGMSLTWVKASRVRRALSLPPARGHVPARVDSPIKTLKNTGGKALAYFTRGFSTHRIGHT